MLPETAPAEAAFALVSRLAEALADSGLLPRARLAAAIEAAIGDLRQRYGLGPAVVQGDAINLDSLVDAAHEAGAERLLRELLDRLAARQ